MMTFEIRIEGFAGTDEALAMQEPAARALCPVAEHNGPCEVPWAFTLADNHDLVLGIYTTRQRAAELTAGVQQATGHPTALTEATPGHFDDLAEQYRIEHPST
ncbi:hypothetical protein [Kribbella sindirgiensis]|uniref:ABM domain-containing protein n=1 Tax=Kribbella sindirgiensis TaxID=1124744 RepID=A0A4R0I6G9_9ACTN|nr:hypothetical protein [Kribbella sindirgiensis]TCC20593.1 hypothetical protein E0H50_36830 [Kribbella sindirgiensis]